MSINVLGVGNDGLGFWQVIASLFPGRSSVTTVRVTAALNGFQNADGSPPLSGGDGGIQAIRLYNLNQQLIGQSTGKYIGSGGFQDFSITQPNNQQAVYAQIGATNDAICIPVVTTTWVDGSQYGWVGDWGWKCGLPWYWGNYYTGSTKARPRCTWIDNDHTNGYKAGMIMIKFPAFTDARPQGNQAEKYCGFPALRAYTQLDGGSQVLKRDEIPYDPTSANATTPRLPDPRLVISIFEEHNATELCESETSHGPDFVSLNEGVYCNMETRETLPLCAAGITADCFDVNGKSKVKRDGTTTQKAFAKVINWE